MEQSTQIEVTHTDSRGFSRSITLGHNHNELTPDDWQFLFATILYWESFHPDTIKQVFCDPDDCAEMKENE